MARSLGFHLALRLGYLRDSLRWMVDLKVKEADLMLRWDQMTLRVDLRASLIQMDATIRLGLRQELPLEHRKMKDSSNRIVRRQSNPSHDDTRIPTQSNYVMRIESKNHKTLRHPSILKCIGRDPTHVHSCCRCDQASNHHHHDIRRRIQNNFQICNPHFPGKSRQLPCHPQEALLW